MNENTFNATLVAIKKDSEALSANIHEAGLFALSQANEHGNTGFGVRLIDALGRKHNAKSVAKWLQTFGKFGVKDGVLVYKARKDINASNLDAWLTKADDCPYWELTPDTIDIVKINYLALLEGIVKRHKKAQAAQAEGKQVVEQNEGVVTEVEALLAKYKVKPVVPEMHIGGAKPDVITA